MDVAQTINHFKNQGALTNAIAQQLSSLAQSIDALAQQGNPYSDYLTLLDTRSSQITNDAFMSCAEKEFLLNITAALKGYVLYAAESNPFAQFQGDAVQSRGCFWDWIGCFFRTLIKDILIGAFIGGVVGLITGTDVGVPNPGGGITIVGPATAIGAAIGAIAGILHAAFTADDCCPDELDCRLPAGLSLSFATCAAAATYTPWGVGSDVAALRWFNPGGTPIFAIATAPHALFITQDAPNVPVITTHNTVCADGSINAPPTPPAFARNLSNLVLEVSEFSIIGKKSVASGQPFIYSVQGVAANDGRHTFSFSVNHGTIIAQSGSQITVEWDDFGEGVLGEVIVTAQNICPSGKWKTKILYVDDDL